MDKFLVKLSDYQEGSQNNDDVESFSEAGLDDLDEADSNDNAEDEDSDNGQDPTEDSEEEAEWSEEVFASVHEKKVVPTEDSDASPNPNEEYSSDNSIDALWDKVVPKESFHLDSEEEGKDEALVNAEVAKLPVEHSKSLVDPLSVPGKSSAKYHSKPSFQESKMPTGPQPILGKPSKSSATAKSVTFAVSKPSFEDSKMLADSESSEDSKMPADQSPFKQSFEDQNNDDEKFPAKSIKKARYNSNEVTDEVASDLNDGFKAVTFLDKVRVMNPHQRQSFFSQFRDFFITIMNRGPDFKTNKDPVTHMQSMDKYLSQNVLDALDRILKCFRSYYFRVSVEGRIVAPGHHPLFNQNCYERTGILDPIAFSEVPCIGFLTNGPFLSCLLAEIREKRNDRLRTYLAFHLNAQLSFNTCPRRTKQFVRQLGLTVLEVCFFYFVCSRRRIFVEEESYQAFLVEAMPYFPPDDIKLICNYMSSFITANSDIEVNLNQNNFIDHYGGFIYQIMMGSVRKLSTEEIHMALFHPSLADLLM